MTQIQKEKAGYVLLVLVALCAVVGILIQGPIKQDVEYHLFADSRTLFSIPNFWNVVSNLPFLIIGSIGLYKATIAGALRIIDTNKIAYSFLFAGTTLVSLGSSYYHLWPDNQTLVWDRLPMTIAFMGLFSIVIGEFVSVKGGKALFFPLVIFGVLSVFYWHFNEVSGNGDLRYYALVQFFPMLAIPIILVCFRSRYTLLVAYWWLLVANISAKLLEHYDGEIYSVLGFVSGHSIKHVAAALGLYILLVSYEKRNLV